MKHHRLALFGVMLGGLVALPFVTGAASAQLPRKPKKAQPMAGDDSTSIVTIHREVFTYEASGRRDPFVSLMTSSDIRPALTDLRLTTVAYDPMGRNSVAVLRDLGTKEQYRVKVGSPLGRMRVARIDPKGVTFTIEEFGFNRQATLTLGDSTHTRTP